jgi:hypothetical protein
MSAYFCSSEDLALIASYAVGQDSSLDYASVQRMLIIENLRSLNARYHSDAAKNTADGADRLKNIFTDIVLIPDNAIVLETIKRYDYQSCEHSGYADSDAHMLLAKLLGMATAPTDNLSTERARLAASFAMPAAPESTCLPATTLPPSADRLRGAILLSTLARLSAGRPDGTKFADSLAGLVSSETAESRAFIESEAAANVAAIRLVLV